MFDWTLPEIFALLSTWGYALILPVAIIEGPIVAVIAGFLVSLGRLNATAVFLILMLGDFFGDLLYYHIGRWGHGPWTKRFAAWIGFRPEYAERLKARFRKNDAKIILLNKTQALGGIVLYCCGALRMPLGRFLLFNMLGSVPKVIFFEAIGFYFGKSYMSVQTYINYAGVLTLLIPVVLLIFYWRFSRYAKKEEGLDL